VRPEEVSVDWAVVIRIRLREGSNGFGQAAWV